MKFILLILGFVAITVGSTYFVAPQFRAFHEAELKQKLEEKLGKAGYIECDVKMNHLHAERIDIRKIAEPGETKASIKEDVKRIVDEYPGSTTDEKAIYVEFEYASGNKEIVEVVPDGVIEASPDTKVTKPEMVKPILEPKPKPETEPKTEPEPEPVLAASEIYIEWNRRKNEILVSGKMSNSSEKEAIISLVNQQFKDAVVKDLIIADKDEVAAPSMDFGLQELLPVFKDACVGKGSIGIVDKPATLTLRGVVKDKAAFEALNQKIAPIAKAPMRVANHAKYFPSFTIEKDDKQRAVILSGFANRNDSVNLSSYIKRYTQKAENQYEFKSDIAADARAEEYVWTEADQSMLDKHLESCVRGRMYYENDLLVKVTGVTTDEEYQKMLIVKFANTATKMEVTYDENAKPHSAMNLQPNKEEASAKEQNEASSKLRSELKEYKIYFKSGKKDVDAKYDPLIKEIAVIILKSEDKKSVIVIGGFADHTGNPVANEKLSKERAASVQMKLVELGVPITRTVVEFFGAEGEDADKKLSRRVEIRVR